MDSSFFLNATFEQLAALADQGAEETPYLEFKRKAAPDQVELQRNDKKLLGEVVSGFANATGGVLILGIGTQTIDGIDRASEVLLISEVQSVANRYRAYAADCASPPVNGVQVRAVESSNGEGLIVIHVPQGQARPHMSRAPDHHTYYRRVIDRFVPMEAYEVEEMMRLKTAPELALLTELRGGGSIGDNQQFELLFGLENVGRVTAKYPYVQYLQAPKRPRPAEYGLTGNGPDLWQRLYAAAGDGTTFAASSGQVIHPGQRFFVSKLEFTRRYDHRFGRYWGLDQLEDGEVLDLTFAFGCEDHPRMERTIVFTRDEVLSHLR